MPAQPGWFHNIESILEELRTLPATHLDRRAVEKLFGVGERRARDLMRGLPCLQIGNAVAVERLALISRLEDSTKTPAFDRERVRRERVEGKLAEIRRLARARQVELPAKERQGDLPVDLSAAIQLIPGELIIRFDTPKDLAAKLFELSQAMIQDWESFERRCGS
jgi:hypothetical protein